MNLLLPLVALALAFAAPFVLRVERLGPDRSGLDPLRLGALLVLVVGAAVAISRVVPPDERTPALLGLVLGTLAAVGGAWTGGGTGIAFGVAAASALHLFPASALSASGLALMAGAGLGALVVGGETAVLAAVLVAAADNLGMRHSANPAMAYVGSQVGLAVAVGALVAAWPFKASFTPLRAILAGAVVAAGALLVRAPDERGVAYAIVLGAVAGLILDFLVPSEGEAESSRTGLAAVIGVALATVAFGLGRGLGMGLAALAALGVLLSVGNRRAALSLGPLVGLVLYRVLRESGTGATRALDLGQHYALLALVLGLTLPLLPTDWLFGRSRHAQALGSLVWGVVLAVAAPLVVVALGPRGGIGFVVGLGTAGLVQAMRGRADLRPLALGAGLGGATIAALVWLGDEATLTRDAKVRLFGIVAVALVIAAATLTGAARLKDTEAEVS